MAQFANELLADMSNDERIGIANQGLRCEYGGECGGKPGEFIPAAGCDHIIDKSLYNEGALHVDGNGQSGQKTGQNHPAFVRAKPSANSPDRVQFESIASGHFHQPKHDTWEQACLNPVRCSTGNYTHVIKKGSGFEGDFS